MALLITIGVALVICFADDPSPKDTIIKVVHTDSTTVETWQTADGFTYNVIKH